MYIHVCYIYLQNWVIFKANVGKYSIHGAYGIQILSCWKKSCSLVQNDQETHLKGRGISRYWMTAVADMAWPCWILQPSHGKIRSKTLISEGVHAKISGQLGKKRWSTHKSVMFSDDKQMIKQISRWHWLGLGLFQWGLPRTGSSLSKGRHVQRSDSSQVVSRL